MTEVFNSLALAFIVGWPLLIAIPALHSRLPRPRLMGTLPAVLLTVLPGQTSLELPWFLFGTGLAIDSEARAALTMSVTLWIAAAALATPRRQDRRHDGTTTFFLLTLAGSLGTLLAVNLTGFLSFSTLMGYSFYGLLVRQGSEEAVRAGRRYLIFLVLADLVLFEALLIAASTTEDLRYEAVRRTMAKTPSAPLYLAMALAGFMLRAGVWPFHLWLKDAYRSAGPPATLLLGAVPVAMGLLGALRWLPLGDHAYMGLGTIIQGLGATAMLYAVMGLFIDRPVIVWPARAGIAITGLAVSLMGTGLAHPALWHRYNYFASPFIASIGILLAGLAFASRRREAKLQPPRLTGKLPWERVNQWANRWIGVIRQWTRQNLLELQSFWRLAWRQTVKQCQQMAHWKKPAFLPDGWGASITLFVLLGLAIAWLAG